MPAIAILGGISIHEAVEQIGGFSALLAVEPKQSLGFIAAISICMVPLSVVVRLQPTSHALLKRLRLQS